MTNKKAAKYGVSGMAIDQVVPKHKQRKTKERIGLEKRRDELIAEINELNKKIDSENEFKTGDALIRYSPVSWRRKLLISVATMGNVRFEW